MQQHPDLLVGIESSDDAGIFKLNDDLALVQTVDIITPIVDDPETFGKIAAANSISDIYAMGATPRTALNICCFPINKIPEKFLEQILWGACQVLEESGCLVLGGHTIEDEEVKFGLSVSGFVHPNKILRNNTGKPGDILVLTKPLGTGIVSTAIKAGMASEQDASEIYRSMTTLNKTASEIIGSVGANACTDVTGFGLIGHLMEMVSNTELGVEIESEKIPFFSSVFEHLENGMLPGGAGANQKYYSKYVEVGSSVNDLIVSGMYDPQTSGGLLAAVPQKNIDKLIKEFSERNLFFSLIGTFNRNQEKIKIL